LVRQKLLQDYKLMKIVLVTGGFDPIHSGHIAYLRAAKELGDQLIVGVNSDAWLVRKKSQAFMPLHERMIIVSALTAVDAVYRFDDRDGTAIAFINAMKEQYPNDEIIFANGGDRTADNIPEMSVKDVVFKFGVGGADKANSSSWILEEWKAPKTERPWGEYRVLYEQPGTKVKELTVEPGQSLSLQRHDYRAEYWHIVSGKCVVDQQLATGYQLPARVLQQHDQILIPIREWHRLHNPFAEPCKIVEIQYGKQTDELDIERKD
jgi:cytidyltransferase-like protein